MLLSIVIPVGPDDAAWKPLLNQLLARTEQVEIILSACQPKPRDALLNAAQVSWITGPQGRASQLNYGASQARGEYIWFLHADTQLNSAVWQALETFTAQDSDELGYFQLSFSKDGPLLTQLNATLANWRSGWLGLPFGDQGFILKKSVFDRLSGFDEQVSPGEDLDFVVRARSMGVHLQGLNAILISSARRYLRYGWLKTSLRHIYLTAKLTWQAQQRVRQI